MEDKIFPGQRRTRLYRQTPGVRNAIYPWVISQDANGATIKLTEEQMRGIVKAVTDAWDEDLFLSNAKRKRENEDKEDYIFPDEIITRAPPLSRQLPDV